MVLLKLHVCLKIGSIFVVLIALQYCSKLLVDQENKINLASTIQSTFHQAVSGCLELQAEKINIVRSLRTWPEKVVLQIKR